MSQMCNKKTRLIFIVSYLLMGSICSTLIGSSDNIEIIDLSINIPTDEPKIQYGNPVWIRGIWHYVNITLDSKTSKITIVFYHYLGSLDSDDRDETNYYEWEYDNGVWKDVKYENSYINENHCNDNNGLYSFYIGIDQYAEHGNWTLELVADNKQLLSKQIYVDNAIVSLTLKSTPVTIRVEPFTEDEYISENKFTVENIGNVPLNLSIDCGQYQDIISILNFDKNFKPFQIGKYNILLYSRSNWGPGILKIKSEEISLNARLSYIIPPKRIVNLIESNVSIGLPIDIYIGHTDYELEFLPEDITFQYKENLEIYYGEVINVYAYISGDDDVTIDISSENLDVLNIFSGSVEVETPFTVKSNGSTESNITVRITGIKENTTAFLCYDLEIRGEHLPFTTEINIGSSKPSTEEIKTDTDPLFWLFILCIIVISTYLFYFRIKYKWK